MYNILYSYNGIYYKKILNDSIIIYIKNIMQETYILYKSADCLLGIYQYLKLFQNVIVYSLTRFAPTYYIVYKIYILL